MVGLRVTTRPGFVLALESGSGNASCGTNVTLSGSSGMVVVGDPSPALDALPGVGTRVRPRVGVVVQGCGC